MAPASNEEQFKFLISCIRYSNNGKASFSVFIPRPLCGTDCPQVDFTEVAKECNIVSKGAAAKRYERMMKANGIHQSQSGPTTVSSIRDTPVPSSRRKASPAAGPSNKKRKVDNYAETTSNFNADDDEGLSNVKAESSVMIKAEPIKAEAIKEEPLFQEDVPDPTDAANSTVSPGAYGSAMGFDGANDGGLFDDFLAFGGSFKTDYGSQAAYNGSQCQELTAAPSMAPGPESGDGQGMNDSILILD